MRGVTPLPGISVIASYASRWQADVAAARLRDVGYGAAVLVDPAVGVAPHHGAERMAIVVVREETAESARDLLEDTEHDDELERIEAAFHTHRFADRPTWVRYATWSLLVSIPEPLALTAAWLLWSALRSLFP